MIGRRDFLRSASAAVALPLMPSLAWRRGCPAASAVRAVWLYFPNGVPEGSWHPRRVGRDGRLEQLNEALAPLEHHKRDLVMFEDVYMPEGNGHGAGWQHGNAVRRCRGTLVGQ